MSHRWPNERYSWYVVFVLLLASTLSFVDRQILSLLVEPIRADLGLTDTQISVLQGAAFTVTYVLMGYPIGWLADRRSRRLIISVGITAWSVMTALCGLSKNFWQLAFARMGVGAGEASLSPAGYSIMADYFPPNRLPLAMSIYSCGIFFGSGLALVIGGAALNLVEGMPDLVLPLVGELRSWQMAFVIVGLPGVLIALLVLTIREPERLGSTKPQSQGASFSDLWRFILRNRWTIAAHFGGMSLLTLYGFATLSWLPTFLIRTYGYSADQAGFLIGPILLVFGTTSAVSGGWVASRFMSRGFKDGTMRTIAIGSTIWAPLAIASYLMPNDTLFIVFLIPAIFFGSMHFGISPAMIQLMAPNELRGQMSAIMLLITTLIGLGFGPTSVALFTDYVFADTQAIRYSLSIVAALTLPVAALVFWVGLRPFRRSLEDAEAWA